MKQSSPLRPFEKAVSYLRDRTAECQERGQTHLESISELACLAGVSYVTMWKAVRRLREDSCISITRDRHLVVGELSPHMLPSGTEPKPATQSARPKWQRLAVRLYQDILNGRYGGDAPLPQIKQLLVRYGVSYPTMRKALLKLSDDGILIEQGTSIAIATQKRPRYRRGTIIMVHRRLPEADRGIMRAIHSQCARDGLRLEMVSYTYKKGRVFSNRGTLYPDFAGRNDIVGVLVLANALEGIDFFRLTANILKRKLPVAVLDESGWVSLRFRKSCNPLLRVFTFACTSRCGYLLGTQLIRHGHRSAVYIGYPGAQWSQNRYRGMRQAFAEAGLEEPPAYNIPPVATEETKVYRSIKKDIVSRYAGCPEFIESYRNMQGDLHRLYNRKVLTIKSGRLLSAILEKHAECTCWVGANDMVALMAADYIDRHGGSLERKVAIAGFDDTPETYIRSITSFNFNLEGTVAVMLTHLTEPFSPLFKRHQNFLVEIDGWVADRGL